MNTMSPSPTTNHPFSSSYGGDATDAALVRAAVNGSRQALQELVQRHQGFVHSLAQRMLYSPEDAADATQEILLCILTGLSSFRGEAAFRTWAYRIAVRQLMAFKKSRTEQVVKSFTCFAQTLDGTPDLDLPDQRTLPVDVQLVVEEAKVGCLMAMLLCLDREQRMSFVLGEIFEASDTVAADVLGISRDNARQRLSRAREQLRQFLSGRCGLVDPRGTCQCARKTQGFIRQGIVDPTRLRFTQAHLDRAKEQAALGVRGVEGYVEQAHARLLRAQPMAEPARFARVLRDLFERPEVRRTLGLEN